MKEFPEGQRAGSGCGAYRSTLPLAVTVPEPAEVPAIAVPPDEAASEKVVAVGAGLAGDEVRRPCREPARDGYPDSVTVEPAVRLLLVAVVNTAGLATVEVKEN